MEYGPSRISTSSPIFTTCYYDARVNKFTFVHTFDRYTARAFVGNKARFCQTPSSKGSLMLQVLELSWCWASSQYYVIGITMYRRGGCIGISHCRLPKNFER
jgi:hypothetical protein